MTSMLQNIQKSCTPYLESAYNNISKYNTLLVLDTLKDFNKIISSTKRDADFKEVRIRASVICGSIVGLVASVAAKVTGVVLGSSFLRSAGSFGFYTSVTCGFIALAGLAANTAAKTWGIKNENTLIVNE